MSESKKKAGPRSGGKSRGVPKGEASEPDRRDLPVFDNDDRDSRHAAAPKDASRRGGGARDATSTGGQQQGGPGSPPFSRFDHANDGGSPKNR